MYLIYKRLNKINYCSNKEIKVKVLKSFISKNYLGFSLRIVTIAYLSQFKYYSGQLNNFCNENNKFRSVFRFFRLNRLSLCTIIKSGLIKQISKSS